MSFKIDLTGIPANVVDQVNAQLPARAAAAANELRTAALEVLRGQRSGKSYTIAHTKRKYRASAPGEPPAARTGTLRRSWRPVQYGDTGKNPAIESDVPYAHYMEEGTPGGKIAPRPFVQKIIEKAKPGIEAIYSDLYNITL